MKKFALPLFLLSFLSFFSQSGAYKDYFRFDVGYEQNQFLTHHSIPMQHNAWNTRSVALEFEVSFQNQTAFARNYRPAFGITDSGRYYAHIPAGPLVGILGLIYGAYSGSSCSGVSTEVLLFLIPEGFSYFPVQTEKTHVGIYANFLAVDFAGGSNGGIDYAPDAGIKLHYLVNSKMFFFARASGKYSTKFGGWGIQGTAGIGWDFNK